VKIGQRPAQKVQTIYVKDGWARPQHIERVKARLAARTPFIAPINTAVITYAARAPSLLAPIETAGAEPVTAAASEDPRPISPSLKDEGWG